MIQPQINAVERDGHTWHLEPKVMQVLVHLASHPNEVLSKQRMIDAIWRDTFVGDDVLIRCISEIRYVFGDDPRSSRIIQTIPKGGYRLIATVSMEVDVAPKVREQGDGAILTLDDPGGGAEVNGGGGRSSFSLDSEDAGQPWAFRAKDDGSMLLEVVPPAPTALAEHSVVHELPRSYRGVRLVAVGVLVAFLCVGAAFFWRYTHPDIFDVFWGPVVDTHDPALFCIADQNQYSFIILRDAKDPNHQVVLKDNLSAVVIDDLDTIVKLASVLRARGKRYLLKGEEATSLTDLRNGPSIFVGAFDNTWALRLTKPLRYHFDNNPEMTQFRIVDSESPSQAKWMVERSQQMATNNYHDYAIVARFTDSNTGKPAVVVAGIGRGGTIAAGEFVTDPDQLAQILRAARAAGDKKNMEIVLSTQIIDGKPGAPKMEAAYFW
nr:winged helix-turn-helix domain-containing protein [Granulicella sp. dw_53]